MILTDNAKLHFYEFLYPKYDDYEFCELTFGALPKSCKIAQIIEWLDYVGIYIYVDNQTNAWNGEEKMWQSFIKLNFKNKIKCCKWEETRNEAAMKAIETANKMYNKKYKL